MNLICTLIKIIQTLLVLNKHNIPHNYVVFTKMECKNMKYNILSLPRYFDGVDHYQKKAIDVIKEISNNHTEFQKISIKAFKKFTPDF